MRKIIDVLGSMTSGSYRFTRAEYWTGVMLTFVLYIGVHAIRHPEMFQTFDQWMLHGRFAFALSLHASFLLAIGRLHDVGLRGWWVLLPIIPVLGTFLFIMIMLADSNRFHRTLAGKQNPAFKRSSKASKPFERTVDPLAAELERLTALRRSRAIDDDEFDRLKQRVLGSAQ